MSQNSIHCIGHLYITQGSYLYIGLLFIIYAHVAPEPFCVGGWGDGDVWQTYYNYSSLSWVTCFLFHAAFCFMMHMGTKPVVQLSVL